MAKLDFIRMLQEKKLIRFFAVSGLNTLFGYGLFALLILCRLNYPLALLFSTLAGILFNFKTIGVLVFKKSNNILVFKFFGVYGITYCLNLGGLAIMRYFGVNIYLGGAILLIPVGLIGFLLNKVFVFN
jgi:putative flippase GtrA